LESKQEREIYNYVKSIYGGTIIKRNRKLLKGLEMDIYIPELKVGIELDGLYWHSEKIKKNAKNMNKRKIKAAKEAGIKLLCFYEDEWQKPEKRDIVRSIISAKLGKNTRIYAKHTELKEIPNDAAKAFLDEHHLDGYVPAKKSWGLFYNDTLVMCVTTRTSIRGEQELARMASVKFMTVVGGASKLLKAIPGRLMSYSNNRVGNGEVYKTLGFKEDTLTTDPSYYYTDFDKRVWRFKCKKLKDFPGTEREQAAAGLFVAHFGHKKPVYRIYDYGHRRWVRS